MLKEEEGQYRWSSQIADRKSKRGVSLLSNISLHWPEVRRNIGFSETRGNGGGKKSAKRKEREERRLKRRRSHGQKTSTLKKEKVRGGRKYTKRAR